MKHALPSYTLNYAAGGRQLLNNLNFEHSTLNIQLQMGMRFRKYWNGFLIYERDNAPWSAVIYYRLVS
jgi:hypothetical protein